MEAILSAFLNPILPIFTVAAVGFAFGRRGVFDVSAAQALNRFVLLVALPALLFSFLLKAPFEDFNWLAIGIYFVASLILYALGFLVFYKIFNLPLREALLLGMACCFTNHVFFVLHIAVSLYGEQAALVVLSIIAGDAFLIFGGTMVVLDILEQSERSFAATSRKLITNPMLISLILGLALGVSNIELHPGIVTYVEFVGASAAPVGLFALGLVLSRVPIFVFDGATITATLLNLTIHPLLIYVFLILMFSNIVFVPGSEAYTIFFVGAGPVGAMPFALALQYGIKSERIIRAIIYTTIISLISLAVIA